jgi:glycosyltransferase involved in cell wall biosynthesis
MIKETPHTPLISVVMPVYNGEKHLDEAICSILNQTYSNFEFIIINDGSTDNSESIILSFKDSRIKYIKNEFNLKLIETLNLGIEQSKGKYIARMDADDISHPQRFEKQVSFFESNSEYGLLGTSVNLMKNGKEEPLVYHLDHDSLKFALAFYCPFIHPSVMFRKECLDQLEIVYDKRFLHSEDYELWTRLVKITKIANLSECLLNYRIHDEQISTMHATFQTEISKTIRVRYLCQQTTLSVDACSFVFKFSNEPKTLAQKYREIHYVYTLNECDLIFQGNNLKHYLIRLWKNETLESHKITLREFIRFLISSLTWKSGWSVRQLISIFIKTIK